MAKSKQSPSKRRYKGGAEKKRNKKAKLAAEAKARAESRGEDYGADFFRKKMIAPPSDAIGTIAYANKAAGILLHSVLTDDGIESESERRKLAKDFIAVIGMTHSKALYEERLKKLEQRLDGKA